MPWGVGTLNSYNRGVWLARPYYTCTWHAYYGCLEKLAETRSYLLSMKGSSFTGMSSVLWMYSHCPLDRGIWLHLIVTSSRMQGHWQQGGQIPIHAPTCAWMRGGRSYGYITHIAWQVCAIWLKIMQWQHQHPKSAIIFPLYIYYVCNSYIMGTRDVWCLLHWHPRALAPEGWGQ